jgi:hypothetical protein
MGFGAHEEAAEDFCNEPPRRRPSRKAEQWRQRNGEGEKKVVLLMDGQESLWQAGWDLPARARGGHRYPRSAPCQ